MRDLVLSTRTEPSAANVCIPHPSCRHALTPRLMCRWARTIGNVAFEAEHGAGGHFAAHERPDDLAADVRAMFGKGGPAFGVVPGSSGYD